MKKAIFSQKLSNHTFYIVILIVVQWMAIFMLTVAAKPLYIVIFVPLLVGVLGYLSRKSKLLLALCCVSFYLGYVALFQEVPKNIGFNKCFKYGISYPGTREYSECVTSLKQSDYVSEIFKW
jgi:hypothetical protein